MTHRPDFDELIGADVVGAERERLRRTHELLLAAGPPAELAPELEAGPTLAMTLARRRPGEFRRRAALLAAAAVAIAVVFLGGYITGNGSGGGGASVEPARTLSLHGTASAPSAFASLRILPERGGGNWPMTLSVTGLPKLPQHAYYEVYLVRGGEAWAPCGTFRVAGSDTGVTVTLNAPYELLPGDSWVVTKQLPSTHGRGKPVLVPA